MSDKIRFTPVRGTEAKIQAQPYANGHVYFTTDTKQIYMDYNGQNKIPMGAGGSGAGSGIILGNKNVSLDESTQSSITFQLSELNIDYIPNVDALILNTPDGYFYKVTAITDDTHYVALRLNVAGSGGGGGSSSATLTLAVTGLTTGKTFVYGQSSNIVLKGGVDNGDAKVTFSVLVANTYAGNTTQKTYGPYIADTGANYNFDLGSVLKLGDNTVKISVTSDNAGTIVAKTYSMINCVEMYLQASDDFNPLSFFKGTFNFYCIPVGEDLTKNCYIYIDDALIPSLTRKGITAKNDQLSFTIPGQTHGAHTIKIVMTCDESTAQTSLSYNICCIEDGNDAPVIWYNDNTPTKIINHDILTIEYMVYNPLSTVGQEMRYYINSAEIATSPLYVDYTRTSWLKWRVNGYIVGNNTLTLKSGTTTVQIPVEVEVDTKRNLDIVQSGLHVNLTAVGRSNNENSQSRQTWKSTSLYDDSVTEVTFNNFNWYNNGWITDDDGETCLRISNGASISIPLQGVLNSKALSESLAFEFVFRVRNVGHYGTLINTEVSDADSDTATVTKSVSSTEGVWGSYYKNSIGFCLGTQEAFFKTKNALVSGRYKEDELIHLTFVVESAGANSNSNKLIYIYINGINSGITKYNITTDSLKADCTAMLINSEYCDVDLYNFRVYKANLTAQYVIQNYLADYNDADLYDMNENIVTYSNGIPSIDYLKMLEYNQQHEEAQLMPYMLIESTDPNDQLPYYKCEQDAPWKFNVTFVNPTTDYEFNNNKWDSEVLRTYGYATPEEMYIYSSPSYYAEGAELNVQGTSSQGYPIRNYKIKLKGATSWIYTNLFDEKDKAIGVAKGGTTKDGTKVAKKWHMMNNRVGENKATLKADYMESASVHNSGFANLIGKMYSKHPLDDYTPTDCDTSTLRTSVCGFPFLMFQKLHTGTGSAQYKFLGWYNYNLDKGCDDTYGFCDWGDDHYTEVTSLVNASNFNPAKLYVYATVTKIDSTTQETTTATGYYTVKDAKEKYNTAIANGKSISALTYDAELKYYRLDEGEDSNALNLDYDPTDPYSRQYYPWGAAAECWEFSNNQGGRCSFKKANFAEVSSAGTLSVLNDFEYRYHVDADSIDNCLARDHYKTDGDDFSGATDAQVNTYMLKKMRRWEKLVEWVASTDATAPTNELLATSYIVSATEQYNTDSAAYRLAKFKKEFESHFDKEYAMIYYIMTELLLCYDSRGKNLMLATWGPHTKGGNDIWYPIFYDIDTQLGVNNSGVPYWDYYEEASDNGTFSTADSVLWTNLWTCFSQDIMSKFNALTGNQLTIEKINGAYSFDPKINLQKVMEGGRPVILKNVDEYQKYIVPSISGYTNTANQTVTSDAFYYCLQGTRQLQREMFLRNRFNYISSKWRGGDYSVNKAKQGVQMRFDANDYPNTSDRYLNSENPQYYFSKPEEVASAGKTAITSQATYDNVKERKGEIYLLVNNEYVEDTSNIYDGSKSSDYYVKNDYLYSAYPHPLDFVWDFQVTPYLKQYVSNIWDDTQLPTHYASDGETVTIPIPDYKFNDVMNTANYPQQLVYFGGAEYLSSLGDLSKKYIDQLSISGAYRLKDLLVGSDVKGYWNNMMNTDSFHPDDSATITVDGVTKTNPNAKSLLEKVVLTNLTGLTNTIDFSGSEKLKELRALGTNVSSFILADGVQIAKLHLPSTITNLILKEPTSLTGILSSPDPTVTDTVTYSSVTVTADTYNATIHYINTMDGYKCCNDVTYFKDNADYPDFTYDETTPANSKLAYNETRSYYIKSIVSENVYPTGLYIEGLTNISTIDANSVTSLDTIDIIGGNMGYDSYNLLDKTVQIKQKMINNSTLDAKYDKHLSINLENVNWTPYRQVAAGEVALSTSIYYLENDHSVLALYNKVSGEYPNWTLNVANGKVYEYDSALAAAHGSDITSLDILDIFIDDYVTAKGVWDALDNKNNFDSDSYNFYQSTDSYAQGPTLAALTGSIFINNDEAHPIEEAKLKNYYHDKYYPKLTIFAANVAKCNVSKFVEVINETTSELYVWDTLKYPVTGDGARTYPVLTTVTGSKLNYDFKGWSTTFYTQAEIDAMTDAQIANIVLKDSDLTSMTWSDSNDRVLTFYAIYTIHSYTIKYELNDGTLVQSIKVPATQYIPLPNIIATTNDAALDEDKTYKLLGYSRVKNGEEEDIIATKPGDATKLNVRSTQDLTFYAVFTEASVYDNVVSNVYLTFTPTTFTDADGETDPVYQVTKGYVVSPADGVSLSGKITLPIWYDGDDTHDPGPVITVTGFNVDNGCSGITRIFFEKENVDANKENKIRRFDTGCFKGDTQLVTVEIPTGLRVIAGTVFESCTSFITEDFSECALRSIGTLAFSQCFSSATHLNISLPGTVTAMNRFAFSNFRTIIDKLQIGSTSDPSQLSSITNQWVRQNDSNVIKALEIICDNNSYERISNYQTSGCFNLITSISIVNKDAI